MAHRKAFIGTSGWHYDSWVGPFYPEGTRAQDFLTYYCERFSSVEINNTFYQLPDPDSIRHWARSTPKDFRFACKASRYTTHMKKLKDPEASSGKFFAAVEHLGAKRGPVLFQLPARWHVNPERLAIFLDALPPGLRCAFEFRDRTWFCDRIYDLLKAHGAALCAYHLEGYQSPIVETADFAYVRLHGAGRAYSGSYDDDDLKEWASRAEGWRDHGIDLYCYFNNDQHAAAPRDAARLQAMIGSD